MENWNLTSCPTDEGQLIFKNRSRTLIRLSERVSVDVIDLVAKMEGLGVPFAYTDHVKEIYFTLLIKNHGYHDSGKIQISFTEHARPILDRILVHELAHNVDWHEGISEEPAILEEKRKRARFFSDKYARTSVAEYVAVGFEVFYCGSELERERMRKLNPRLYSAISQCHRKYQSRSSVRSPAR